MEREAIKEAVKEALAEEIKVFYVDREIHYQHHEFIKSLIKLTEQCKNIVLKTVVSVVVVAILGLIALGLVFKTGGKQLSP